MNAHHLTLVMRTRYALTQRVLLPVNVTRGLQEMDSRASVSKSFCASPIVSLLPKSFFIYPFPLLILIILYLFLFIIILYLFILIILYFIRIILYFYFYYIFDC